MTPAETQGPVAGWISVPPVFTRVLKEDAEALAGYAEHGEAVLAGLPAPGGRDASQERTATTVFAALRRARRAFLALHTDAVYDTLTDAQSRWVRLPDLLHAAAARFPGLVPDRVLMEAENGRIQAHKDGREIDQAIFCGAVLRSPAAGRHLIDAMLMPTRRSLDLIGPFRDSGRVELDSVLIELHGEACHVTFQNPHSLNAEDNQLIADLEVAVDLTLLDERVRVGVLRGGRVRHPRYDHGRVFSAGINLKDLRKGAISYIDFLLGRELGYIHKMFRGLVTYPAEGSWTERAVHKPWVGAVDSFAIGGGLQLLLVLDRVIAERGAYFSLPAAEEGIVPGLGNLRLTRLTGARLARQMILSGRTLHADEAEARLLCDDVVPAEEMEGAIDRAVRELSAPAVAANRLMLNLVEEPIDLFREYMAEFAVAQAARAYSQDVLDKVERRWQRSRTRGVKA